MGSLAQYPADPFRGTWGNESRQQQWHLGSDNLALPCRAVANLTFGSDTTRSGQPTWHVELEYMAALRQAQACIFAFAQLCDRALTLPKLLDLPGKEHGQGSDQVEAPLAGHMGGNATAVAQPTCLDDTHAQLWDFRYGDHDLPDADRTAYSRIDLKSVANVRELKGKKKKNQASKANAWESDNEDKKDSGGANEGTGGELPGDGGGDAGGGGSGDGEKPGGDGGRGDDGKDGKDEDEDWNYGSSKKAKKAKKKQNAFSWAALDEEDVKDPEDDDAAVAEPTAEPVAAEAEPEDDWAGFTTASKKKKKKGKTFEPDPPPDDKLDEVDLDESNTQILSSDPKDSKETKAGGFEFSSGWGSGWGSSAKKWDFSAVDNAATEDKPADTGFDGTWGSFGKKDKKGVDNAVSFGYDAPAEVDASTSLPQEDKPEEEDPWAGFSTAKKKKKKKGAVIEDPPRPSEPEIPPEPEDLLEPVSIEPEPEEEFSCGMTAKDKKKAKKAAKKAVVPSHEPEPEREAAIIVDPEPASAPDPELAAATEEAAALEEALPEEDLWAGFSTQKKKKKGKTTEAAVAESEPPPSPPPVEEASPPEPEPEEVVPEPEDDFCWGMSAKEKKKAKRAAKKGLNVEPEPEPEPKPEPTPEPEPSLPEPIVAPDLVPDLEEPVEDFTWGMTAKEKKKAKRAAKSNALHDAETLPDQAPAPEEPTIEDHVTANDETALVVVEQTAEADDWFSGWGTKTKKKSKKSTPADPVPVDPEVIIEEEKESEGWTFGWGQTKKDKKKKGKDPSPEPEYAGTKDEVIMTPESVDEPEADLDDDAGWGVGTKKKKIGKKEIAIEVKEPSPEVPIQKPEEDSWAWTTGKKAKKGKKGSLMDPVHPPAPTPPSEPAVEETVPSVPPVAEEPLIDLSEPAKAAEDDIWAYATKKSKKDKKGRKESKEAQASQPEIPQHENEPVTEDAPLKEETPPDVKPDDQQEDAKKGKKEEKKKEEKTSGGWGLFGSSSKARTKEKDKDKERKERKEKEAAAEKEVPDEQEVVDLDAENVARLDLEPTVDVNIDTAASETKEPVKAETAAGWVFWSTALKPVKQAKSEQGPEASQVDPKIDDLPKKSEINSAEAQVQSSTRTKAKGSIADRIKALQETSGVGTKLSEKDSTHKPASTAAEDTPKKLVDEPDITTVDEHKVSTVEVQESPVDIPPTRNTTKGKDKKKSKSSKIDKSPAVAARAESEPEVVIVVEPEPTPVIVPADIIPIPSPVPGEFPVEEDFMPEVDEMPVAPPPEKKLGKAKKLPKSSKSASKKSGTMRTEAPKDAHDEPTGVSVDPVPVEEDLVPEVPGVRATSSPEVKSGKEKKSSKSVSKPSSKKSGTSKAEASKFQAKAQDGLDDKPVDPLVEEDPAPELTSVDVAPSSEKEPRNEKKASKSTSKSSSRKSGSAKVEEASPSQINNQDKPKDETVNLQTDPQEPRSSKKERPKIVRDQSGLPWGFWTLSRPDPKHEHRKELRAQDDAAAKDRRPTDRLSRSKSARKPSEDDRSERAGKTPEQDRPRRESRDRASASRGLSFSGAFGLGSPALSRTKSARGANPASKSSRPRPGKSLDTYERPASRPADDIDPSKVSSKAAEVMGIGNGRTLKRGESMREKRKSRGPIDPYAVEDDLDAAETRDGSTSHSGSKGKHRSSPREPIVMSGALADDPVMVDVNGHSDEHEIVTGPEDLTFVRERTRPPLKRSATITRKSGLLSGLLSSRRLATSSGTRDYDSDNGPSRRSQQEAERPSRPRTNNGGGSVEDESTERRRARRAERHAAEAAEAAQTEARRREKELARRIREEEEAAAKRQDEKRARRAARRQAEEQEAKENARRLEEREREQARMRVAEDMERRERRERHPRREQDRMRSTRRNDGSYGDVTRNGERGGHGDRATPSSRPYLPDRVAPDKTTSWVRSFSDDPPLPPPVEGTILDAEIPAAISREEDRVDAEETERDVRRRQRRERERNGDVNSSDERRRRRREERRLRDEEDWRPSGGVRGGKAWLKKLTGF